MHNRASLISIYTFNFLVKNNLINLKISCVDPDQTHWRANIVDQHEQSCSLMSVYTVYFQVRENLINLEMRWVVPGQTHECATNLNQNHNLINQERNCVDSDQTQGRATNVDQDQHAQSSSLIIIYTVNFLVHNNIISLEKSCVETCDQCLSRSACIIAQSDQVHGTFLVHA